MKLKRTYNITAKLNQRIDQKFFFDAFIIFPKGTSYFCGRIVINAQNHSCITCLQAPATRNKTEVEVEKEIDELIKQLCFELFW